jgi:hypothetical protein
MIQFPKAGGFTLSGGSAAVDLQLKLGCMEKSGQKSVWNLGPLGLLMVEFHCPSVDPFGFGGR